MIRYLLTAILILTVLPLVIAIVGFLLNTMLTIDSITHYSVVVINGASRLISIH
jgi:hypothetical protein